MMSFQGGVAAAVEVLAKVRGMLQPETQEQQQQQLGLLQPVAQKQQLVPLQPEDKEQQQQQGLLQPEDKEQQQQPGVLVQLEAQEQQHRHLQLLHPEAQQEEQQQQRQLLEQQQQQQQGLCCLAPIELQLFGLGDFNGKVNKGGMEPLSVTLAEDLLGHLLGGAVPQYGTCCPFNSTVHQCPCIGQFGP
jgi:hypothetical protein